MSLKKEFEQSFLVMQKGNVVTKRTSKGRLQTRQELKLRDPLAAENEGNHSVLFFDSSVRHLESVEVGSIITLQFKLHAGISTTGMSHTNIVPTKIIKP